MQVQRCGDSHSSSQMHYLNILDKCSQIMREDRIWLRSQIKNNSQDALVIFKGLSKLPNMKQLQIKLRKFVNHTKQKEKQQQLVKFKENMNSTMNVGIKEQFNYKEKENQRESYQKNKTMQTQRHQSSNHSRSPLQQTSQNRQSKSLLSKWNNYAHNNYNSSTNGQNFLDDKKKQSQSNKSQTKKQWVNIYKPHTFNKMLNGQLNNKLLSNRNMSATHLKRDTKSVQPKNYMDFNQKYLAQQKEHEYQKTFTNTINPANFGLNRNNNNSLKKFDYKPTKEVINNPKPKLTTGQQQPSKYKIAKQPEIKSFTKPYGQSQNEGHYTTTLSKQNINQILKYKLGYPYQFDGLNQQNNGQSHNNKNNISDQKYNSGHFPTIQEQTERDSEYLTSQRNQRTDDNKIFSIVNSNQYNHNKNYELEGSVKQNNNKGFNNTSYFNNFQNTFRKQNFSNMLTKNQQVKNNSSLQDSEDYEDYEDQDFCEKIQKDDLTMKQMETKFNFDRDQQKIDQLFSSQHQNESSDRYQNKNIEITQHVANRLNSITNPNMRISFNTAPMIQSRQKSQISQNVEQDLHKSILNSIRKSQQDFPSYGLQNQSNQKQVRFSIPKSSSYDQFQSKSYSNPQQKKYLMQSSQTKTKELNQTANHISNFSSTETPLNFNITAFSATTNLSKFASTNSNDQDLFTPPDLLNQCRMFLKKSKQLAQINCDYSIKPLVPNQQTPQKFSNLKSVNRNNIQIFNVSKPYVPEKRLMIDDHAITVTESITKDFYFSSQKNSQQKQNYSQMDGSDSKLDSKKVNFQLIGSVKPMQNEYKQFSQHKHLTEKSLPNKNSSKKNSESKNDFFFNESSSKQKPSQSSMRKQKQAQVYCSSNKKQSNDKNIINQSQQSIKSKKVQEGDVVSYDGIHTFSNQSLSKSKQNSNQKTNRSTFNQVMLFDSKQSNKKKAIIKAINELICLEDLVDQFLQASQGNLQVSTQWLLYTIQNHCYFQEQVSKSLQNVLSVFLNRNEEYILLIDVFQYLFGIYKKDRNFQFKDGNAKDIYLLLDIQKKGRITIEDINSFSQSLEQAQIQNFQVVAQKLQQMFDLANLTQSNVLTYLNLYIIKNQSVFEQVCQLLEDFQFQIEGE